MFQEFTQLLTKFGLCSWFYACNAFRKLQFISYVSHTCNIFWERAVVQAMFG